MKRTDATSRRDAMLLAAKEAFLERGFELASMDDVAARAGTTKRTLYNHFADKEALFRAVVGFAVGLFVARLPAFAGDAPPEDQLEAFAARYCELATWKDSVRLQRVILAERDRFPDLASFVYRETTEAALDRVAAFLRGRGAAEPDLDARAFLNAATSHQRLAALHGVGAVSDAPPGDEVSAAVDRRLTRRAAELVVRQKGA